MNESLSKLGINIIIVFALTIGMGLGALFIDRSYFEYPIAATEKKEDYLGVSAKEGYKMPVSTEFEFDAGGADLLQIDLAAKENDLSGFIELTDPSGKVSKAIDFNLKKYPKGFLPNHKRWVTSYLPGKQKGVYKLTITQNNPGKMVAYIYQGPFVLRIFLLPLAASFLLFLYKITFANTLSAKAAKKEIENKA